MPNGPSNQHFWTTDPEGEILPKDVYGREGVAFYAYKTPNAAGNLVPIVRFYGGNGQHFWTQSPDEKPGPSFNLEGPAFYVPGSEGKGTIPIYRFYDGDGHHFWTKDEHGEGLKAPFHREGVAFYALAEPSPGACEVWRFYAQQWQKNVNWSICDQGLCEPEVQKEWERLDIKWPHSGILAAGRNGGRRAVMRLAIEAAAKKFDEKAKDLTVSTQLHNPHAADTIRRAHEWEIGEFLRHAPKPQC